MLLILTSNKDLTADFLIVELLERGLPYFRLNAEEMATSHYRLTDGGFRSIRVGPRTLDVADVTAVWYRRAIYPMVSEPLSISERVFLAGEVRHLVFGMLWDPTILWVNPIDKVYIAEHKVYQLGVAQQAGLRVPRTLVSSDPLELKAFTESNPGGTIAKPIYHGLFVDGADAYSVYTRRVSADEFTSTMELGGPVLLQEEIARRRDLRVTFIGDRCFTAAVHASSSAVDWREPMAVATFVEAELDSDLRLRCATMLKSLGLHYGAFDFIETPEGDFVFLEVNPTGEWAWLENALGFPMRSAFVKLLYGEDHA
jgi:hypothetical protein